jgi:hypothetical protein
MTDEKRPIRQISGNMQEFQAAIRELADAVAGSARITGKPEVIWKFSMRANPGREVMTDRLGTTAAT